MAESNHLPMPHTANQDPQSFEILRVWIANRGQHVSIRAGIWEDPAMWGMMLCDLAGHIANAYQQEKGMDRIETLRRIKVGFDAEFSSPTDQPRAK
jgi:hypothetical protein